MNTPRKENKESIENINGRELFAQALEEIYRIKLSDTSNVSPFFLKNWEDRIRWTFWLLDPEIGSKYKLPKYGISSKVLLYIALKRKNINIVPSTISETFNNLFDFKILGKDIDITCSTSNNVFRRKFSNGHPTTLFVPHSNFDKTFLKTPQEKTFAFDLIYNNTFDQNKFLTEIISANRGILNVLTDYYENGNRSSCGIDSNNFGDITPELIFKYDSFLNSLSEEIL